MPYIKLLTALAGLALLTACAGGVTVNPTVNTGNNNNTTALTCTQNPFGTGCTAPTQQEAEAFCGDDTKTTATKPADCAQTIKTACTANVFDLILCTANEYVQQRKDFNDMCINQAGKTKEICDAEALVRTCAANPFMDTCLMDTGAIALRESRCLANIQIDDSCRGDTGIATVFCKDDPFNTATACMADTYLPLRITNCITAGNAGIARCNNLFTESASNTCLTNPFTDACTSDGAFATYADTARVNRVGFCASDSTGSSLCTALTTCQTNPFDATCGAYFADAKISHCETNDVVACPNVTTADLLASFTANGGTAPPATPDATTRKDEFLQGTATGFNTGANADIRATFGNPTTDIAIQTLTFAEANTATGGVAFFGGELYTAGTSTGTDFYYAGVLAGTDLGAPITENITSAKWTGQIRANANIDGAIINVADGADFELDITFDGAKGTITTIFARGPQFVYEIDGMFDENGIITGSVDYGAGDTTNGINMASSVSSFYSPGTLTGIIGQNGAVGAFHSNNNTGVDQASFSGGFVVLPPDPCVKAETCVNTADWTGSFTGGEALTTTPNTATPINEFLAITETTASSLTAVVPTTLFMTGSTTNGLAFFTENGAYYAGVLAGTNLGAPITAPITSARWEGEIRADSSDSTGVLTANPTDGFGVNITFNGTGGTMTTIFASDLTSVYDIDGKFDENGIITGTIDFGAGDVTNGINPTRFRNFYSPGTLTGIIGQNGAVGVFHSDNDNPEAGAVPRSFAGGFIVTPPAQ